MNKIYSLIIMFCLLEQTTIRCTDVSVDKVDMILTVKFEPDFNPLVLDSLLIEFKPTENISFESIQGSINDGGITYYTTQHQGVDLYVVTLEKSWIEKNLIQVNPYQYELDLPFHIPFQKGSFQLRASAFKNQNEIGYGTGYLEYPPHNLYKRVEQPLVIFCHEQYKSICKDMEK